MDRAVNQTASRDAASYYAKAYEERRARLERERAQAASEPEAEAITARLRRLERVA